ncbi:hypothetical protein [Pseudogemmobacter humi]|uniref:Uncharacterized protein n=1 Tax=Pseudogemmobacter humi TaxID=2483812 RepID=A0A3P5XB10_9RHOB|nr:hypothetical protein [Pseudogemmobacter humi]VDC31836.1 hypothetical protein XINFAN_03182 [Pseudogemmobacter humi]
MKFDPFSWNEVKTNEKISIKKGWLRLRLSAPCPLYVEAEGCEALVGVETSFDVELSEAVSFCVAAPKGVRAFLHVPPGTVFEPQGEVYTNIDRMPDESGNVLEVRRAMRQLELERRAMLRSIRAERDASLAALRDADRREPATEVVQADPPADTEVVE